MIEIILVKNTDILIFTCCSKCSFDKRCYLRYCYCYCIAIATVVVGMHFPSSCSDHCTIWLVNPAANDFEKLALNGGYTCSLEVVKLMTNCCLGVGLHLQLGHRVSDVLSV